MAPVNKPPFDPPIHPSCFGVVAPILTKSSATALKSSKDFHLFSFLAQSLHSGPNSPPPRMHANAKFMPWFRNALPVLPEYDGKLLILNPPYPFKTVGFGPLFSSLPFARTKKYGTFVPSLDVASFKITDMPSESNHELLDFNDCAFFMPFNPPTSLYKYVDGFKNPLEDANKALVEFGSAPPTENV